MTKIDPIRLIANIDSNHLIGSAVTPDLPTYDIKYCDFSAFGGKEISNSPLLGFGNI